MRVVNGPSTYHFDVPGAGELSISNEIAARWLAGLERKAEECEILLGLVARLRVARNASGGIRIPRIVEIEDQLVERFEAWVAREVSKEAPR